MRAPDSRLTKNSPFRNMTNVQRNITPDFSGKFCSPSKKNQRPSSPISTNRHAVGPYYHSPSSGKRGRKEDILLSEKSMMVHDNKENMPWGLNVSFERSSGRKKTSKQSPSREKSPLEKGLERARSTKELGTKMKMEELGDFRVAGIINRFDDFIEQLKFVGKSAQEEQLEMARRGKSTSMIDRDNEFQSQFLPKRDIANMGNGQIEELTRTISSLNQKLEKMSEIKNNRFEEKEEFNWIGDQEKIKGNEYFRKLEERVGFLEKENERMAFHCEQRDLEIRKQELRIRELLESVQKVTGQRNMFARLVGMENDSADEFHYSALCQMDFASDTLSNDINAFIQENFILRKYNEELKGVVQDLQNKMLTNPGLEQFALVSSRLQIAEVEKQKLSEEINELHKEIEDISIRNKVLEERLRAMNIANMGMFEGSPGLPMSQMGFTSSGHHQVPLIPRLDSHPQTRSSLQRRTESKKQNISEAMAAVEEVERIRQILENERMESSKKIIELQNQLKSDGLKTGKNRDVSLLDFEQKIKEINLLQTKLAEMNNEKQQLLVEVRKTKKTLEIEQEKTLTLKKNEKKLMELAKKFTQLSEKLKKEMAAAKGLREELGQVKNELMRAENEKKRLREVLELKNAELEKMMENFSGYQDELDKAKSNELRLTSENEKFKFQLKDIMSRMAEADSKAEALAKRNNELEQYFMQSKSQSPTKKK